MAGAARWAKVIDQTRCIGCHACTTACKSENLVPLGVTRTYVKSVEVGAYPRVHRAFQVTRCNQCEDAPCVTACPTAAMHRRPDGIVDVDKAVCIGCKACIAACPYDAIFINPEDHSAEKCNVCAHRLEVGLEPACVVVCPVEAILVGDLDDPSSRVARIVHGEPVAVRRPEKGTRPKLFYLGAHGATLDPLAARRPEGDLYVWSEQGDPAATVPSGGLETSSAPAVLAYDVPHRAPWDWRVSLYTWTKAVAAGTYVVAVLLRLTGAVSSSGLLWRWVAPLVALLGLLLTGGLLVADLGHPERFLLVLLRPQWRSWLARGAVILLALGGLVGVHLLGTLTGTDGLARSLSAPGLVLGVLAAIYTAFLFAQARGRDLWQSPLLPPHHLVQALLAGSAVVLLAAPAWEPRAVDPAALALAGTCLAHLLLVAAEAALPHPTAHGRLAGWEMTRGSYARFFWPGLLLTAAGLLAPWVGPWVAPPALAGLLVHGHAHVQAAQTVPLA